MLASRSQGTFFILIFFALFSLISNQVAPNKTSFTYFTWIFICYSTTWKFIKKREKNWISVWKLLVMIVGFFCVSLNFFFLGSGFLWMVKMKVDNRLLISERERRRLLKVSMTFSGCFWDGFDRWLVRIWRREDFKKEFLMIKAGESLQESWEKLKFCS